MAWGSGSPWSGSSGGGGGGGTPDPNTVGTTQLQNSAVTAAKIADGTITGAKMAAAVIDPVAATAGLRTLGTGAQQALPGNHASTTDTRTPSAASIVTSMFSATGSDYEAALRTGLAAATAAVALNNQNITSVGTVGGRNLPVDGAKLDLLPTSAVQAVSANGNTPATSRGTINHANGVGITATVTDDAVGLKTDVVLNLSTAVADEVYRDQVLTTNATATAIRTLAMATSGRIYIVDVDLVGRLTTHDGSIVHYTRRFVFENNGGTVTSRVNATFVTDFEATTPTNLTAATGPAAPTIVGTNVTLNLQGIAGTNMTWTVYTRVRVSN